MARRLIMHCLPPDGPGEPLQRLFLEPRLASPRRVTLSDPLHVLRARYPEGAPPPGPVARLVSGPGAFGYFDGTDDTVVYVLVLGDPVATFLRFARRVHGSCETEGLRLAGPGFSPRPGDDPDTTALRLLDASWARRTRLNPLTRLCAGAPLAAREGEDADAGATLLRAAQANLARTNLLVGLEGALDGFAAYLAGVFGWAPPQHAVERSCAATGRAATGRAGLREAVRASTLDAVREATRLDAALLQAARQAELMEA